MMIELPTAIIIIACIGSIMAIIIKYFPGKNGNNIKIETTLETQTDGIKDLQTETRGVVRTLDKIANRIDTGNELLKDLLADRRRPRE